MTTVMGQTQPGTIVGTPSYTSPEQVRGLPLDPRTDIWAFGCVLFEMLTGKPAFPGATMSDIVAKILERDPDWAALPHAMPDAMHRVVRWALAKDVEPVWSPNGRELFYRENDKTVVVDVTASETPSFGKPRTLFEGSYMFGKTEGQEFDVSPDGRRFLMLKPQQPLTAMPLNVRVNWFSEMRQR